MSTTPLSPQPRERDHVFISYASEDAAFAKWLTLRLTVAGYRVWCDHVKLLGGESYPTDIDLAIKTGAFRVLAVLSQHSLHKSNPLKERTLALSLQKARGKELLIPLNLSGLRPEDLDWMTSDITFIPFHHNWADGLARLRKKLEKVNAPQSLQNGPDVVSAWAAAQDIIATHPETLRSNVYPLTKLPEDLFEMTVPAESLPLCKEWPAYWTSERRCFVFEIPPDVAVDPQLSPKRIAWQRQAYGNFDLAKVVTILIGKYTRRLLLEKGLAVDNESRSVFFPAGLLDHDTIRFRSYTGKNTYVRVVGQRNFRTVGGPVSHRHHLAPQLETKLFLFAVPVVLLKLRVHLTNLDGTALPAKVAFRRRVRICKSWWNHQWLSREIAVMSWLASGKSTLDLALTNQCTLTIATVPLAGQVPVGIDESVLNAPTAEEDEETLDDIADAEDEEGDAHE